MSNGDRDVKDKLTRLASLAEPVRRALYEFVIRQDHEVSRDEAAKGVKISRALAAFHLDRLADDGLLDTTYRRPPGRSGPGAGRPSKLYQRAAEPVEFTTPPQNYGLIARVLTASIGDARAKEAADETARARGLALGRDARRRAGTSAADGVLVRPVGERSDQRPMPAPRRQPGEVLADLDPGRVGRYRAELAANAVGSVGLRIERFMLRRPAGLKDEDNRFRARPHRVGVSLQAK